MKFLAHIIIFRVHLQSRHALSCEQPSFCWHASGLMQPSPMRYWGAPNFFNMRPPNMAGEHGVPRPCSMASAFLILSLLSSQGPDRRGGGRAGAAEGGEGESGGQFWRHGPAAADGGDSPGSHLAVAPARHHPHAVAFLQGALDSSSCLGFDIT